MEKKLITLRSFYHRHEAEIIRAKLDVFGIPSMIMDGNLLPSVSFYSDEAGVKLKVFEEDYSKAIEIIEDSKD